MRDDDFFIGWAETPAADRRFFLKAGLGLMAGTAVMGAGVARFQNRPGHGSWNMADVREWTGIVTAEPYAMLYTTDIDATPRTVLLGCMGKCGVSARIGALAGKAVTVKGSLIQRGPHAMIAVVDGLDWIAEAPAQTAASLAFPELEAVMPVSLAGEILDSKCWFGAMRPSEGKVHKACASLCIRGGIPPAFYVMDRKQQKHLLILTDQDIGFGDDILEYVADPVRIDGVLKRQGDVLYLSSSAAQITRV